MPALTTRYATTSKIYGRYCLPAVDALAMGARARGGQGHPATRWGVPAVRSTLGYFDLYFVCAAGAFDLDRHAICPFFFWRLTHFFVFGVGSPYFCLTAARNLALRARGLETVSCASATTGLLVSIRSVAS